MARAPSDSIDDKLRAAAVCGASARRMQALRARRAAGRVVVSFEVDEVGTFEMLVAAGLLKDSDSDDHSRLEAALARMVDNQVRDASRRAVERIAREGT